MSTFNGYVKEFPTIRIDHFRKLPEKPNPVVGFLSHVHSDHLQGLETWGKIPLYCSPATRELLLRLEKYPHRMNFAKGILESRKQHYKTLKGILKPIPLKTPTNVEIGLARSIRVTLLDANHCAGAVMFLMECEKQAILYTGDIRSETWWINNLTREPILIPYTLGNKRLDNMYLDTTFATKDERYRKFQSKAAGINELLEKVSKYPMGTVFHFHAWTLGYEDVWIALSNALKTQIHVDEYKLRLYQSLVQERLYQSHCYEGPALCGFRNGNHSQKGCLTDDRSVTLHNCEHGTDCSASSSSSTVHITPITSRSEDGEILREMGTGGGGVDLLHDHDYLELNDQDLTEMLIDLCDEKVGDATIRSKIRAIINKALETDNKETPFDAILLRASEGDIKMDSLIESLIKHVASDFNDADGNWKKSFLNENIGDGPLPGRIQFPYSRHSSYEELCELVTAFRPLDIYPCTIDWQKWSWHKSIESLFGHLCRGMAFAHDQEMAGLESQRIVSKGLKRMRESSKSEQTMSSQLEDLWSSQGLAGAPETSYAHEYHDFPSLVDKKDLTREKRRKRNLRLPFERPLETMKNQYVPSDSNLRTKQIPCRPDTRILTTSSSQPHLHDGDLQELASYRLFFAKEENVGTQFEPIEVSNNMSSELGSQAHGNFLLDDLPEPGDLTESDLNKYSRSETQLTLSDAAFETQLSTVSPERREATVQHRKQAYKAVRNLNGAWADDHGLVCLGTDHVNEELEL